MPDMKRESEAAKDEGEWTLQDCVKAIKSLMEMSKVEKPIQDAEEGKKEDTEKAAKEGDAKDEEGMPKKFVNKAGVEDADEDKEKEEAKDTTEEEELSQDEKGDTEKEKGDMSKSKDKKSGMDAKEMFVQIASRDKLADKLSNHVGTFDHALMTHAEVAKYGIKKLGLQCKPGHEISMLEGYLAAAKQSNVSKVALDSRSESQSIDAYLNPKGSI